MISFYERANWVGKSESVPISESEAREHHIKQEPYGVHLDERYAAASVEFWFGNAYCEVVFHDSKGRLNLTYDFERRQDKLFLFEAIYTTYEEEMETVVARREMYLFESNGLARVTESEPTTRRSSYYEKTVDVTGNWEAVPAFGHFEHLCRRDRS